MSISAGKSDMQTASVITTPLVVVSVVFPVLAALSIHLRLIAKRLSRQPFHSDDWWVIATWVRLSFCEHHLPCYTQLTMTSS